MKKQILSTLLSVSMLGTLLTFPTSVVNAETADFTVTAITPQDGAEMVSAIDDVVITFSNNVDKETVADGISFSGSESYQLVTKKNTVMVIFDKELAYLTDYKVTLDEDLKDVDGNSLTPYEISFKTEYNPITTLWYSDFEGTEAEELAKFTHGANETPVTADMGFYSVIEDPENPENHILHLHANTSTKDGYYPIFKGSNTWKWYKAEYDLKQDPSSRVKWLFRGSNYGNTANTSRRYVIQLHSQNQNARNLYIAQENTNVTVNNTVVGGNNGKFQKIVTSIEGGGGSTTTSQTVYDSKAGENVTVTQTHYTETGASGIVGYAAGTNINDSYVDNLVITDTGYCPTFVTSRKNITDGVIKLNFPQGLMEVSMGSAELVKVTANGIEVDRTVSYSSTPPRDLTVTITNPQPYTEYEITIPQETFKTGNANAAYFQNLSNDKVFTIKTPYVDTALTVTGTTPAMGGTDVAVTSNVTINFSDAVNMDTLEGNITVAGAPDFTIEEIDEDTIALVFDERLDYGKTYTVTLSNEITSASGEEFAGYSFNFTTLASNFKVSTSSIENGSRDVSVLEDMVIYFNDAVDMDTIDGNITVSPATDFNIVEIDNGIILEFADALDYYTDYAVTLSGDIATVDGMPLSETAITFKTAPDMGKALFYENFEGDEATAQARFTEIGSANRDSSENFYVANGALNLPSYYDGGTNQADKTVAQIVDSESWGNIELDFDTKIPDFRNVATSVGASVDVRLRQGTYGSATSWINLHFGDSANNGILKGSFGRNALNTVDPYFSIPELDFTDATVVPDWINTKLSFKGYQGSALIDYEMNAYGKTVTASFDSTKKADDYRETYVLPSGSVAFSTTSRTSKALIDNILVNDLDFAMSAENIKNNEGTATLVFSKAVDTETIAENIKVYDGEAEVLATITAYSGTKVGVTVNNPVSGKVYTIKALEGLTTADGKNIPNERTVEMSVKLDLTISDLAIKSNGNAISALTAGAEIYGSADVNYIGTNTQSVTVILAVYAADGNLYAVKTNKQTVTAGTNTTFETAKYTLPSNIKGFSAQVFCWDDLVNIKPLSDSVVVPQ